MIRSSSVGSGNLPSLIARTIRPKVPVRKMTTMRPHTTIPIITVVEKNMIMVGLPTSLGYRHADDVHWCLIVEDVPSIAVERRVRERRLVAAPKGCDPIDTTITQSGVLKRSSSLVISPIKASFFARAAAISTAPATDGRVTTIVVWLEAEIVMRAFANSNASTSIIEPSALDSEVTIDCRESDVTAGTKVVEEAPSSASLMLTIADLVSP
mmetsp:Transcript_78512/g.109113  ORF Transcript_78512/g.109113 Transcript_78512/m.109113 type:complete len:211 (+) Transcript_78512:73-705(+)